MSPSPLTRRDLLLRSAALGAGLSLGSGFAALAEALAPGGSLGVVPFTGESAVRFGELTGEGLAGRRYFDLRTVTAETTVTSLDRFFVRTRRPLHNEPIDNWRLEVRALHGAPIHLKLAELEALAEPRGVHLLESVTNGPANSFGQVSVADWHGVGCRGLFQKTGVPDQHDLPWLVLVEGEDRHAGLEVGGRAGASWVFRAEDLIEGDAFLATRMNGEPLRADHGAPMRLVVPGWYGCAWIKWVRSILFVPAASTLPTPHMMEYAELTFHAKEIRRASKFEPLTMAAVALPLRVDRVATAEDGIALEVSGISWGNQRPPAGISIRFARGGPWQAVDHIAPRGAGSPWQLWSHRWLPPGPGTFEIDARVDGAPHHRRVARRHYARRIRLEASELAPAS